ncbi:MULTISPECIES: ATP-binding protein [unclassified Meiothermus]|uniref:ATP-binding protein n=1 Tax=unclassified Meiothermus TaxID=370471 RepID=UPI000D7D1F9C|nr:MULTISPECIES: HAMP domain-containing sensor histidine kinase [unclassified Meiothermus]PZA05819.1 sensor histidine kinase [Meiothermus sp. Pnk-1]RYM29951.1 HAMP domain-containing histidine kinase [Meiothermus sp. PNK-Is4]
MTLRLRLALFIALAIALALLAQGVLGYLSFQSSLYATLDRDLEAYAQFVLEELHWGQWGFRGRPRPARLPEGYVAGARLVQDEGVLREWGSFPDELSLPRPDSPAEIRTVGLWRVGTLELGGGYTLQVALQSQQVLRSLQNYRDTVLYSALLVVVLGAGAAWLLAGPALRPLRHLLAATARVAGSGDLSQRVPPGGSGELGQLSQTFNRMMERLQAFLQREIQFTRHASHELRTPLTAIKLQLGAYRQGYAGLEETLQVVEEEAERMIRLSEALLTLAREGRAQRVSLDLAALAREAAAGAGVPYMGPERLELWGDPLLLRQALLNLLDNARKHAGGSGVRLALERRGGFAVLEVSDTGPGMPPEALRQAAEPFYRAPGTRAPGVGLGLSVVAQVAQAHGGRLELEANTPRGLVARLWLLPGPPSAAGGGA